jgi:hypothetical protein
MGKMPKRMSCFLTKQAVIDRIKTRTSRDPETWVDTKLGDLITLIEQGQGLKKGQKQVVLTTVRCTANYLEPLGAITQADVAAEGFPEWIPAQFVAFYNHEKGGTLGQIVRVLRWKYLEEGEGTMSGFQYRAEWGSGIISNSTEIDDIGYRLGQFRAQKVIEWRFVRLCDGVVIAQSKKTTYKPARPTTITAARWSEIEADVQAGRCKVWFPSWGMRSNIIQHISGLEFIYQDVGNYPPHATRFNPDDILNIEWLTSPASEPAPALCEWCGVYPAVYDGECEKCASLPGHSRENEDNCNDEITRLEAKNAQLRQQAAAYRAALDKSLGILKNAETRKDFYPAIPIIEAALKALESGEGEE